MASQALARWRMVACAAVAVLYLYTAYYGQLPTFQQRGILLAFGFFLALSGHSMLKGRRPLWSIGVDAVLVVATILAVHRLIGLELRAAESAYYHRPTWYDVSLGIALIVVTMEVARRTVGLIICFLVGIFLLYGALGQHLPGMLRHLPIDLTLFIYYMSLTTEGIFSMILGVSATVVIMFLIFAAMLQKCGLIGFFMDIASGLVGQYRGGPAKIAVVSSAFMATMSGSAVANVATTGAFTIPLMKKIGYSPDFAGAVEACASTGGVVTPPVMGAAAFLIAEFLGIQYWTICVASFLPAFLYFVGVYTGVDLEAIRLGLKGLSKESLPSVRRVLITRGYMLTPLLVLLYFLAVMRSSAMMAAFWGVISIVAVALIRKETRRGMAGFGLIEGLGAGVKDSVVVVATAAATGIVVGTLTVTGLGMKMSTMILDISGGNLMVLLLLCAVLCIILGMGMTTTSVYLLVATIIAPAITQLGVPVLAAHLFVFFYGNLSHITPPVAVAVFVACGISGGKPFATGWQACKLGIVLFILPFFFALDTALLLQGSVSRILIAVSTAAVGVLALCFGINGYWFWGRIRALSRVLFGLGGLGLIYPGVAVSAVAGALVLLAVLRERHFKGREPMALPGQRS